MKKTLTTILLATVLLFGATFANAGIIIAGAPAPEASSTEPCTDNGNTGIIIAGYTGIIIAGYAGIIIAGVTESASDDPSTELCGIIIAG